MKKIPQLLGPLWIKKKKVQCKIKTYYRKSEISITSVYKYLLREYYTSCQRYSGDRETEYKLISGETRWL